MLLEACEAEHPPRFVAPGESLSLHPPAAVSLGFTRGGGTKQRRRHRSSGSAF